MKGFAKVTSMNPWKNVALCIAMRADTIAQFLKDKPECVKSALMKVENYTCPGVMLVEFNAIQLKRNHFFMRGLELLHSVLECWAATCIAPIVKTGLPHKRSAIQLQLALR